MVTVRLPFYWRNTTHNVRSEGANIYHVIQKKDRCRYDHKLANEAYLSDITVTNKCIS